MLLFRPLFSQVGWIDDSDSTVTLLDAWSASQDMPVTDVSLNGTNNVGLIAAMQVNKTTTIMFSRKLVTGDLNDYAIDAAKPFHLLYALSPSDGFGTSFAKHTEAGAVKVDMAISSGSAVYVPTTTTPAPGATTVRNDLAMLGVNASAPMFVSEEGTVNVWWSTSISRRYVCVVWWSMNCFCLVFIEYVYDRILLFFFPFP